MSLKQLGALAIPAALFVATPASAQYMPHLDPNTYILATMQYGDGTGGCMAGTAPPEDEIDEARLPAPGVMQAYFDAAQSGGTMSASFRESKKSTWAHGSVTAAFEQIDAQRDPLAVAGNRLDPDPLRFFRAGSFETAHGQWSVLDADGSVAGVYDAQFKRQRGEWKLQNLTVLDAGEKVVPAMQYCWEPGDVTPHMVESAGDRIEYLEKQIAKSEEKLVKEQSRLAGAEEKLAAKPDRSRNKEAVARARTKVEKREEKLADLREGLEKAQESLMKSNRDASEIAAMTLPVRDALRLRGFETTTAKEKAEEEAAEKAAEEAEAANG
ncbi:hypothetical protein [Altererythrobacter sp. MF3-039]|uniref:hypothetical protein n=1 Tax=Altererythrobacter sp. MF3-039 TaxID=3252901 RepID=UPI00390C5155